jgi:hypothetical protein
MDKTGSNLWPLYGFWAIAENYDERESQEALAPLEPAMLQPAGGRRPLWLPSWDDRSVWGFDPQSGAYFAQLWRNPDADERDDPDIWILGLGTFEGQAYAVTTAQLLAQEIAVATGASLAAVCRAMLGLEP